MARRFGSLALVLVVALSCHDSPAAPEVTSVPSVANVQLTNVLATMRVLLDDPLVSTLIAETDHTAVTRTMQQVMDEMTEGDPQIIGHAVTDAWLVLTQAPDDESLIARAALSLTLDALHTILDDATSADSGTNAVLTNPTRSP